MRMIKKIVIDCENVEITSQLMGGSIPKSLTVVTMYEADIISASGLKGDIDTIMENLNFEDVMNYYGVSKVGEWAEANR
jgi:hypothetical protein